MAQHYRAPMGSASVYQIDFNAVASGKRIASTKRRIRWRFGFANSGAIEAGQTGTSCRGEEHDVTLVWSVTSGKRHIIADGHEVHFSVNRGNVFDFSWKMRGNHVLRVVASAAAPINPPRNYRQYNFFVNGLSFFAMPKVYSLGANRGHPRAVNGPRAPPANPLVQIEAPRNADEEDAYLQTAIQNSLQQTPPDQQNPTNQQQQQQQEQQPTKIEPKQENLLLDFFSEPAPAPAPQPSLPALPAPPVAPVYQTPASPTPSYQSTVPAPASQTSALVSAPAPYQATPTSPVPSHRRNLSDTSEATYPFAASAFGGVSRQASAANVFSANASNADLSIPTQHPFTSQAPPTFSPHPSPGVAHTIASHQLPASGNPFDAFPATAPTNIPPQTSGALVVSGAQSGNWGAALPSPSVPYAAQPTQPQQTPNNYQYGGYGAAPAQVPVPAPTTAYGVYANQTHQPPQQQQQPAYQYQQHPQTQTQPQQQQYYGTTYGGVQYGQQ